MWLKSPKVVLQLLNFRTPMPPLSFLSLRGPLRARERCYEQAQQRFQGRVRPPHRSRGGEGNLPQPSPRPPEAEGDRGLVETSAKVDSRRPAAARLQDTAPGKESHCRGSGRKDFTRAPSPLRDRTRHHRAPGPPLDRPARAAAPHAALFRWPRRSSGRRRLRVGVESRPLHVRCEPISADQQSDRPSRVRRHERR